MADEAVFPIRYPTDTSGLTKGISELDRLKSALQEDQKAIAGFQKAMASLKLDPDVQSYQKMQAELKKAGIEAEKAGDKLKSMQAERAKMVSAGADSKKLEAFDMKGGEVVGKLWKSQERIEQLKNGIKSIETKPAVRQFKDLETSLKHTESAVASNQSKYLALGGDMTKMGDKVKSGFDQFAEGADQAGLGIGGLKQKFEALKALGPAGAIAAIVITVIALGAALAKATFDLAKFALEAGDAARSTSILMEAATGSSGGAKEMGAMVRRLRNDFASSREEIAGMALELRRSGLEGRDLERTVRLVGISTKTMGDAAGGILKGLIDKGHLTKRFVLNPFDLRGTGLKYEEIAKQVAKMTGRTIATAKGALLNGQVKLTDGIAALEAAVKIRFGDLAKRQLLALPVQLERAKENLKDIFAGINPDKFLTGFSKLLGLLDETTESGKALRMAAKTVFQPLLDNASAVFPLLRGFIMGTMIAIVNLGIVVLKTYLWFKKTFGDSSLFGGLDGVKIASYAGAAAIYVLVGGIGLLTAALFGAIVAVAVITAPFWSMAYAIYRVVKAIGDLRDALKAKFTTPSLDSTNVDTAKGITDGIKSSAPAVNTAFAALADGGVQAYRKELEMASPSKRMEDESYNIGTGAAKGIDASRDVVAASMSRLVDPSDAAPAQGTMAQTNGGSWSFQTMFGPGSIVVNATDGKVDNKSFMEQLTELIENINRQGGLVPQP